MANNKKATANKPVEELRLGAIKAAIWQNEAKNGHRYNVRITRLYKDGDEWKTSDSSGVTNCPWSPRSRTWPTRGFSRRASARGTTKTSSLFQ